MKRFKMTAFFIVSALSIALLVQPGCAGQGKAKAQGSGSGEISGTWEGNGIDTRGVTWEFTFTLLQRGNSIEGESTWKGSEGSSATSTIKGTVDIAKKTFIMNDVDINDVAGDVKSGIYTGTFSADFKKMKGKWTIPSGGSAGTFEAVKM